MLRLIDVMWDVGEGKGEGTKEQERRASARERGRDRVNSRFFDRGSSPKNTKFSNGIYAKKISQNC
jgi:hypothetical protein